MKGHAEHGPGIYLTSSWETANKYAKGGGAVYRMTVQAPRMWLEKARIQLADALAFVRETLGRGKKAQAVIESINRIVERTGDPLPAFVLVNTFVNNDLTSGNNGPALATFLIDQGIDASHVRQGSEDWMVVFNPAIIKAVVKLSPKDVGTAEFPFDLPRL